MKHEKKRKTIYEKSWKQNGFYTRIMILNTMDDVIENV